MRTALQSCRQVVVFSLSLLVTPSASALFAQDATVRSQAVVNLTFDEPSGDAQDSATAGAAKDTGVLVNAPARIRSPFWNQTGKQALVLDAGAKQFVQIADSADVDRPDAVTVSLLYVNLHPKTDGGFHGLFAKRDDTNTKISNYGINYVGQSDVFQVYVNDGTGYKVANFSTEAAVGFRRPAFITTVFQVGDAPAPDADEDKDDVLVRFFVNGRQITPKSATGGQLAGSDAWLTDVKVATLVNDAPLTVGSSMPTIEYTNCVLDEFSLFAKALSNEEVAKLFVEVAGPNVDQLIADDSKPVPAPPVANRLSVNGLQSGQTTVLEVTGANLLPDPQLLLPFPVEKSVLRPGATANRVVWELTVAASIPAGHYPLKIQTAHGVSSTMPIAVDALPQLPVPETSADKPLTLPAALSGTLSGQQQVKVFFAGKAGQRLVIDLECKRLGSAMDPVLEFRNPRGAPLGIAWGKPQYDGDTRIETHLLADGVYSVELHDLAYKAPGLNHFRLKLGELKIADAAFPPAISAGTQRTVSPIGPGMDPNAALTVDMGQSLPGLALQVSFPPTIGATAPVPAVMASESAEILEETAAAGTLQSVDAQFNERAHVPVFLSGRISQPGEMDRFLLQVKPGMTLNFSMARGSLRTPLEAQLRILSHPDGNVLAQSEERPDLSFGVPANVSAVQLAIRDLNRRGGPDYLYRVQMIPAGQPDFSLSLDAPRIMLARDGSTVLRIDVNRAGYNGPIALSVQGAPEVTVSPAEIPAGVTKALVSLSAKSADASPATLLRNLRLTGESVGLQPPLRRFGQIPPDTRLSLLPGSRSELAASLTGPAGLSLELGSLPPAFFKGTDVQIPIAAKFANPALAGRAVRLTLQTTEAQRTQPDPADPTRQRQIPLPLVRSLPEQSLAAGEAAGNVRVAVPLDVAEPQVDCVVKAEFVPHPFSDKVLAVAYSTPFRLSVQPALAVQLASNTLSLTGNAQTKFTGTIKRTASFAEPVDVTLINLPQGYSAPKVSVPGNQETFEITVTSPAVTAAADLPNIAFRVTTAGGQPLAGNLPVATKVAPGQ